MDEKKYDPYTGYEIHEESEPHEEKLNQESMVIGDAKESYRQKTYAGEVDFDQTPSSGIALASMILGIVSVVLMLTCCCSPIAIFTGIAAIVCFAVSPKIGGAREKKASAGLICGIVSIIGTVLLIIVFIFNIVLSEDFQKALDEEFNDAYEQQVEDYDDTF